MKLVRPRRNTVRTLLVIIVASLFATSCTQLTIDNFVVASDQFQGRANGTAGSAATQRYLIDRLKTFAVGVSGSPTGPQPDSAFKQPFDGGTNILARFIGTDLPNDYVIIGAHYDHLGSSCRTSDPADQICNGATDNGAGVAALLGVAQKIARSEPRRSVLFAFWDREEDGLLGSKYYTANPVVPLAQTVAYINFDIQGANLLPSLQNTSFAVGAESGGATLTAAVNAAIGGGPIQTRLLSSIFGQGRSDYVSFTNVGVPNVFFTDSTGPCYHTAQDSPWIVDFWKLDQQVQIAYRLAMSLIQAAGRPAFSATNPVATFDDARALQAVANLAIVDMSRFTATQQQQILTFRNDVDAIVAAGPGSFGDADDIAKVVGGAATMVSILTTGPCNGFIPQR